MKSRLLLFMFISISANAVSQTCFVRLIDKNGKKIEKGRIINVVENTVLIVNDQGERQIPVSEINYIYTRRSAGHNILIGTLTGALIGSIAGSSGGGGEPFDEEQSKYIGLAAGAGTGMLLSLFSLPFKATEYIYVNENYTLIEKFFRENQSRNTN